MNDQDTKAGISRRGLMKRAAITLPVIATIPGVASAGGARTSNMVHVSSEPWPDKDGNTYCLDTGGSGYDGTSGVVDLGSNTPHVSEISPRKYYKQEWGWGKNGFSKQMVETDKAEMCKNGGSYYYKSGSSQDGSDSSSDETDSSTLSTLGTDSSVSTFGKHGGGGSSGGSGGYTKTKTPVVKGAFCSASALHSFTSNYDLDHI